MSRCGSCNRPLRDPRSVELGFGPGCWERLHPVERAMVQASLESATPSAFGAAGVAPEDRPSLAGVGPMPTPRPPQRSDSALAVLGSWAVGLVTVLALVMFWQWLLIGLGLMAATAATGLLVERIQERRVAAEGAPALMQAVSRRKDEIGEAVAAGSRQAVAAFGRIAGERP
jgi:hypothetical protein